MSRLCLLISGMIFSAAMVSAQTGVRAEINFNTGWRFINGDPGNAQLTSFNDRSWRLLDLPHDWSVEGTVSQDAPTGGPGGYYPSGVGWYRKQFNVRAGEMRMKHRILFDGVYMNSDVWLNGNHLGNYPFGYNSFWYDLDPFLKEGDNVIAVRTRPVTVGCDNIAADDNPAKIEFLELLDIVGYNYVDRWHERRELYYSIDRHNHPDWKMVGTESVSNGGLRGEYSLGQDTTRIFPNYNTRMIRAEQLWKFVAMNPYVIGDFMWTGIDYLGESRWPSKHASSGVIDLCGFPKDGYYFYQSQWTSEPVLHLLPHWNWEGREGTVLPVVAYTNCDAVELFVNGKSIGEKRLEFPRQGNSGSWNRYDLPQKLATTADLHLSWDVPYQPGTLEAVGKMNGEIVCRKIIKTAGKPASIRLIADTRELKTDNVDVAHVRVEVLDSEGNIVPKADDLIQYRITGNGRLIGLENGNPTDHEPYKSDKRKVYNGLGLAIIQAGNTPGKITLSASSEGMEGVVVEIMVTK